MLLRVLLTTTNFKYHPLQKYPLNISINCMSSKNFTWGQKSQEGRSTILIDQTTASYWKTLKLDTFLCPCIQWKFITGVLLRRLRKFLKCTSNLSSYAHNNGKEQSLHCNPPLPTHFDQLYLSQVFPQEISIFIKVHTVIFAQILQFSWTIEHAAKVETFV